MQLSCYIFVWKGFVLEQKLPHKAKLLYIYAEGFYYITILPRAAELLYFCMVGIIIEQKLPHKAKLLKNFPCEAASPHFIV